LQINTAKLGMRMNINLTAQTR